jgi:hypothetical protein
MKEEILSYLTAHELLKIVIHHHPCRNDVKSLEPRLGARLLKLRRAELIEAVDAFDYSRYISLFEVLKHWLQHKGLWLQGDGARYVSCVDYDLASHFTAAGNHQDSGGLLSYVRYLVALHCYLHQRMPLFPYPCAESELEEEAQSAVTHYAFTTPKAAGMNDFERVKRGELGLVRTIQWHHRACLGVHGRNYRQLTTMHWKSSNALSELTGARLEDAFSRYFDLPRIAESGNPARRGPRVAYVMSTEQYNDNAGLLHRALTRGVRPLEKARLLERVQLA